MATMHPPSPEQYLRHAGAIVQRLPTVVECLQDNPLETITTVTDALLPDSDFISSFTELVAPVRRCCFVPAFAAYNQCTFLTVRQGTLPSRSTPVSLTNMLSSIFNVTLFANFSALTSESSENREYKANLHPDRTRFHRFHCS